jgi:hypothetical protein
MRKAILFFGCALLALAPAAFAQDHGEVGAFADYARLNFGAGNENFLGVGGRASFGLSRYVQLEAEMNYDFDRAFTEGFTDNSSGAVTFQRSNVRTITGLFGPKFETRGPVKLFATVKGGALDMFFSDVPATFANFTSSVSDVRANNVSGVLYPGGGVEGFLGPIGLRLDVGDEIWFRGGTHNTLRVTFGPTIRF